MEPKNTAPDAYDALRIQAAAVAAQQAALTEEELRLQQRRVALEKQEAQLAAHLDDRRRRLRELQEEIKVERSTLLDDLRLEKEAAVRERQELGELRERHKQHEIQQQSAFQQQERELAAEREQARQDADALQRERATFEAARLKLNGEVEVRRCEAQEAFQELALAQQQWEATLNLEQSERQRLEQALATRSASVAQAEQALVERQRAWEQGELARQQELEGLEKRIGQLRTQLPKPAPAVPSPATRRLREAIAVPDRLRQLVGNVADQRWHLLEQWQRLLEFCTLWDKERAEIGHALEVSALHFVEREQQLAARERDLETRLAVAQQQHERLADERRHLEGWRAHLTAQASSSQSERTGLLAEVQAREESVAALTRQLESVRQRRQQRRRQDVATLRAAHARCEEMHHQYAAQWREGEERLTAIAKHEREFAARRLALEQYRLQLLARSSKPAATEKRLDKLTHKAVARFAALEQEMQQQRDALGAEAARLDNHAEQLRVVQGGLIQRQQELAGREEIAEAQQLERDEAEQQRQRSFRQLQLFHEQDQRQLAALRDEVERVARVLLEDAPADLTRAA